MELQTKIGRQIEFLLSNDNSIYGHITDKRIEDGCDIISVNFTPTSLCQYRDFDIQNTEPLIICVEEGLRPKVFASRDGFPLTPHQNNASNGHQDLCLFDLSYEELKPLLDGSFLLRQIDDWLCKAASNELHGASQPIEPYFLNTNSAVVSTGQMDSAFYLKTRSINERTYFIQENQANNPTSFPVIHIPLNIDVETDNIIRPLPSNLDELVGCFPSHNIYDDIVKGLLLIESTLKFKNEVSNSRILLSLLISKTMKNDNNRNELEIRCVITTMKFGQIRRFFGLDISNPGECNLSSIEIEVHGYCYELDNELAAMYNGVYNHPARKANILQIGVGAIGSQVLSNCVKAGFGQWTIVDNDIFLPHNVARHKLDVGNFGSYKSDILEGFIREIYKSGESRTEKISYPINILDPNNHKTVEKLIQTSDFILDTSASSAVSRSLAIDYNHDKPIMSFFMNPAGNSAIALIENEDRSTRLDTIEYEYFKRIVDTPRYTEHFSRTETVYYSASCRNSSAVISQDSAAAFSALCSKKLKNALITKSAEILIWTENEDGIALDTFKPSQYCKQEIADSYGATWCVFISREVETEIEEARKAAKGVETGGILVGGIDKSRNIIYVVKNIPAPDDSIHAPTSYIRGCKGLPEKLNNISSLSHNTLGYIGEWHSHPSSDTRMSSDDSLLHTAMKDFTSNNCSPAVLIITGNCGYDIYI